MINNVITAAMIATAVVITINRAIMEEEAIAAITIIASHVTIRIMTVISIVDQVRQIWDHRVMEIQTSTGTEEI